MGRKSAVAYQKLPGDFRDNHNRIGPAHGSAVNYVGLPIRRLHGGDVFWALLRDLHLYSVDRIYDHGYFRQPPGDNPVMMSEVTLSVQDVWPIAPEHFDDVSNRSE